MFLAADTSLATTMAFTSGTLTFDREAGTVTVAKMPPLPVPAGLELQPGLALDMRLIAPDGTVKPQKRSGVLKEGPRGVLRIPGSPRKPSARTAEDGWGYTSRRYRAYLTHPGVPGSSNLPQWLMDSISRQRQLWNRIAILCRAALRQCSDVAPEEIRAFVNGTIFPAIGAFNVTQGRGPKMRYPKELKVEEPSLLAVRHLLRVLKRREKMGLPVPEGLDSIITTWVQQHGADYTPIRTFEEDLDQLIRKEADALQLRFWERRAVGNALTAILTRRRTNKLSYTKGWPRYIDLADPRAGKWGIHYYLNSASAPGPAVLQGGVRSLRLGEPLPPERTGHPKARGKRFGLRRQFRAAEIAIPDRASGETWRLGFSIVQHQSIPENSVLKEWKLVCSGKELQLILVLQEKKSIVLQKGDAELVAGMDLGWRRDGCGVRVGTLFNPVRSSYTTIFVDLESRPPDTAQRPPFHVFMGPSRRGIRAVMAAARQNQPGFPDTFAGCRQIQQTRDSAKDRLKSELRERLGDTAPKWIERAGFRKLRSLFDTISDPAAKQILSAWIAQDLHLASLYREYLTRIQARLRKGYERVAHEAGRMLQAGGIQMLAVETPFLAEAAQNQFGTGQEALRRGAHYRQWVAPGMLVRKLEQILPSYGIRIARRPWKNTTRSCHHCGAVNEVGAALHLQCRGCGALLNVDHNAAVNLASAMPAEAAADTN